MKTQLLIATMLVMSSCVTYQSFITVKDQTEIPDGAQSILVNANEDEIKQAFISHGIMVKSLEGGFETEEILIDEATRAKYRVHVFENQVRITCFWGITQKFKSDNISYSGHYAHTHDAHDAHAFDQVIYRRSVRRPKMVFDYAVQIVENFEHTIR